MWERIDLLDARDREREAHAQTREQLAHERREHDATKATCASQAEMNRVAAKIIADQALLLRASRAELKFLRRKNKGLDRKGKTAGRS